LDSWAGCWLKGLVRAFEIQLLELEPLGDAPPLVAEAPDADAAAASEEPPEVPDDVAEFESEPPLNALNPVAHFRVLASNT